MLIPLRKVASLGSQLALFSARTGPHWGRMELQLQDAGAFGQEIAAAQAATGLADWLRGKRVVALSGAGMSTASGIPDYRGLAGSYRRGHMPMSHDDFLSNEANRQRYWARALWGYEAFAAAKPNAAHHALAALQRRGIVTLVVTQNVDGLHEDAGGPVVALHGRGDRVVCVQCGAEGCRQAYHDTLDNLNPAFVVGRPTAQEVRPDADAEVDFDNDELSRFVVAPCAECGGVVKPDVVFFGDAVPKSRVHAVTQALDQADGLLCVGTSLAVYSAFRFILRAVQAAKPICVLNRGPTRADVEGVDHTKLDASVGVLADALHFLEES